MLDIKHSRKERLVVNRFTQEGKVERQLKAVDVEKDVARNISQSKQLS